MISEESVRLEVGKLLHADSGKAVCSLCLVNHVQTLKGYTKTQVRRVVDAVFESPDPLTPFPSFICTLCGKPGRCLAG
jgi:hypothetical protein